MQTTMKNGKRKQAEAGTRCVLLAWHLSRLGKDGQRHGQPGALTLTRIAHGNQVCLWQPEMPS
jgi:hypothetical protein